MMYQRCNCVHKTERQGHKTIAGHLEVERL